MASEGRSGRGGGAGRRRPQAKPRGGRRAIPDEVLLAAFEFIDYCSFYPQRLTGAAVKLLRTYNEVARSWSSSWSTCSARMARCFSTWRGRAGRRWRVDDNYCNRRPGADEGGESDHCFHETGKIDGGHREDVCCFCGDLFNGAAEPDSHGQYDPKRNPSEMVFVMRFRTVAIALILLAVLALLASGKAGCSCG